MMKNHKAFMFRSPDGKPFVVLFAHRDDRLYCRAYGHDAFATREFAEVFSVNHVTRWLLAQGNRYEKRLPLAKRENFGVRWKARVMGWMSAAILQKAA